MANNTETTNQNNASDALKFAIPEKGYGVYLKGILPEDQRVLAGAFSTAMQQIKNIDQVQLEKFAQAAYSTENMFGLNLVNGTDVPTDQRLARIAQTICGLGGGVFGTYTMSNFFGCMSGLPYPLREIYDAILALESSTLKSIYQNLYLAVTWEQATTTVQFETKAIPAGNSGPPDFTPLYDWQYRITGIEINHNGSSIINKGGGGYQRGNTPDNPVLPPNGTWGGADYVGSGSITVECLVGDNPQEVSTLNTLAGTYGRVYKLNITNLPSPWYTYKTAQTSDQPEDPNLTFTIDKPPSDFASHGIPSTGGWPGMNQVVQEYINEANAEIQAIQTANASNFESSNILNTNWIILGKALKQEQRARYIAMSPVAVPYDQWYANYPTSIYSFVDALPSLGGNTLPHMYAQTIENISDLNLLGGQSVVALMRESRNQERLQNAGLVQDNNLDNDLDPQSKIQLLTNNTLPNAMPDEGINGYTIPSFPGETPNGNIQIGIPIPASYYDPCLPGMMCYNEIQYIEVDPTEAILSAPPPEEPVPFEELPETPEGYEPVVNTEIEILPSGSDAVLPDVNFPCENSVQPIYGAQPAPVATSLVGTGVSAPCDPPVDYPLGVNQPKQIIPPELDAEFTSSTLSPSAPTVQQAIDQVIKCNCDCWVV